MFAPWQFIIGIQIFQNGVHVFVILAEIKQVFIAALVVLFPSNRGHFDLTHLGEHIKALLDTKEDLKCLLYIQGSHPLFSPVCQTPRLLAPLPSFPSN